MFERPLRVAYYVRVSTEDQSEKFGPELQRTALDNLVRSKGFTNDGMPAMNLESDQYVYKDLGISGTTPLSERPAFSRLIDDITRTPGKPPFDIVAVYKIDRFARKLKILLEVIDIFETHDIKFVSANESIDTSTPFGKAILGIVGVIAELEIETTKMRTQDGKRQAVEKGKFMGSTPPYGYTKDINGRLERLNIEADVVNQIFDLFTTKRWSPQKIASYLSNSQYPSPDASSVINKKRKGDIKKKNSIYFWRSEKVRKILEDEVYLGKYYFNKSINGKPLPKSTWKLSSLIHEPIIESFTFETSSRLLKKYTTDLSEKVDENHLYLLSGLLKCDHCKSADNQYNTWTGDKKLISKHNSKYSYSYKCSRKNSRKYSNTCTVIPIPAEPLENYIFEYLRKLLQNPKDTFEYQLQLSSSKLKMRDLKSRRKYLVGLINGMPSRKDRLKEQHRSGIITINELESEINQEDEKHNTWKSELEAIDEQLSSQSISNGYIEAFSVFSDRYSEVMKRIDLDRTQKYEIIHLLIDEIIVKSRPVDLDIDIISGRKRLDQFMPLELDIKVRLPKDMLHQLAYTKFGVETSNL